MTELQTRVRDAVKASQFNDGRVPEENLIMLFAGGSNLHGARLEGKNDLDIYGVFLEPEVNLFGLDAYEHFVTSTSDEGQRNTPDDIDITLYSLRRWVQLAVKGNPTALSFLFATNLVEKAFAWKWGYSALSIRDAIIARSAAAHFRGFVQGQMGRLLGTKGTGKHGQRDELTQAHGYDTKAAMHAIRLIGEGVELMETGHITYPRPDKDELIAIRRGKYSLEKIADSANKGLTYLDRATEKSSLPNKPDRVRVNAWLVDCYKEFNGWEWNR